MLQTLLNPKVFNILIMSLYLINSGWWFWHGSKADGFYWLSALAITATVTFGYNRA